MMKSFGLFQFILFFTLTFSLEAFSCGTAAERINRFYQSRHAALEQAKRDAGILRSAQPRVVHVPLRDLRGNPVIRDGQRVMTREYHYRNSQGQEIVIKEHTYGHDGAGREVGGSAHFNVEWGPSMNRAGNVPGVQEHYNIGS